MFGKFAWSCSKCEIKTLEKLLWHTGEVGNGLIVLGGG